MENISSIKQKKKVREKLIQIEMLLQKSHQKGMQRREQLALKSIKTNPKYFFSYAKQFSSTRIKIGPLLNKLRIYTQQKWLRSYLLRIHLCSVREAVNVHLVTTNVNLTLDP